MSVLSHNRSGRIKRNSFEEGFDFLGIHFHRDTYSFIWKDKEVIVDGDVNWLFSRYTPTTWTQGDGEWRVNMHD